METSSSNTDTAATLAARLQVVTDLLAAHPDLPSPCVFAYGSTTSVDVTWQLMNTEGTKDDQRAAAQQIVRAIGGTWKKSPWGDRFDLERRHDDDPMIKLEILAHRDQMCERVVVGTEQVTIPAQPAQPAVEAQPERVEERDVVEWRCAPLLGDREAVSA